MKIDKAIEIIQKDIDDEDVEWDSPLGEAYKLSFEALKRLKIARVGCTRADIIKLPGETEA